MTTPFPGMDPYLERAALWPDVHNSLIVALRDELQPLLRPRYYVSIEERTYTVEPGDLVLAGRADVAVVRPPTSLAASAQAQPSSEPSAITVELDLPDQIRETYLEVRALADDQVVTLIELRSPTNKRAGEGREQYLRKRRAVLASLTHLVEIDLLRSGEPMPLRRGPGHSDYRILVSRGEQRPHATLLPCSVRQPLPPVRLPLIAGDAAPEVELTRILHALYDRAGYDLRVDYRAAPEPPLEGEDASWADALLRNAGLR